MNDPFFASKSQRRILVVEAHPDDAAFFMGGTIAKLANEGHTIINLCSTYGEKGTLDSTQTSEQMITLEKEEAEQAAKVLGIKEVLYLEIPDGELTAGLTLRRRYTEIIRRIQPDAVFSFDPYVPYDPHPDHYAAGRTIFEACFTSHYPLYYPEHRELGLKPHYVTKFYGWNSSQPNLYFDITQTLEQKIRALEQYESQILMLLTEIRHRLTLLNQKIPLLDELNWQDLLRLWVRRCLISVRSIRI